MVKKPMTKKQYLMTVWRRINKFNEKTAILVGAITGSMFFFWAFVGIIAYIRGFGSEWANSILTACENDIQVLLISSNSVTSALTLALLLKLLHTICKKEDKICAEIEAHEPGGEHDRNKN